jgi:undecaprenyl phosphate N,N'-diacetylbacillosamine 1-phosphate transferase
MYRFFIKRLIDIIVSFIVLMVFSPVMLIIIILLFFANKGNPFFSQMRPGLNERIFRLVKFKTMNDSVDSSGKLLPDNKRLTTVGKFLRQTSLDELPQLINVLKGDMSLIGPRPLLVRYLDLYDSFQKRRHEVKPGITGWAQVNGRNAISWDKRFEFDVWYVENLSFLIDMKILYMTFIKVIRRDGINSGEQVTMKPFSGSSK